jgi:hypothetical protein
MRHDGVPDYDPDDPRAYAPYASREELLRDYSLAVRGYLFAVLGRSVGSSQELQARRAFVRLQRVGDWPDAGVGTRAFAKHVRNAVISLLDPDNETGKYELVLQLRRTQNGRLPRVNQDRAIVHHLRERLTQGGQMKAAIEDIAQKFDVARATVYNAWRREEECQKENLSAWLSYRPSILDMTEAVSLS